MGLARFWHLVTSFVDGMDKKQRLKVVAELTLGKRSSYWVEAVYGKKDNKNASEAALEPWGDGEKEVAHRENYRNYLSGKSHMEKIKEHVLEDVEKGWMKRVSLEEAQNRSRGGAPGSIARGGPEGSRMDGLESGPQWRAWHPGERRARPAQQDDVPTVRRSGGHHVRAFKETATPARCLPLTSRRLTAWFQSMSPIGACRRAG